MAHEGSLDVIKALVFALHLQEGKLLAELWFLEVVKNFRASMGMVDEDLESEMGKMRWAFSSAITGQSICKFAGLPEEAEEGWPLHYRDMVIRASGGTMPELFGHLYVLKTPAALPGPDDGHKLNAFLASHLNPAHLTVVSMM